MPQFHSIWQLDVWDKNRYQSLFWPDYCEQSFLGQEHKILTFAILYFGQIYFDIPIHM